MNVAPARYVICPECNNRVEVEGDVPEDPKRRVVVCDLLHVFGVTEDDLRLDLRSLTERSSEDGVH